MTIVTDPQALLAEQAAEVVGKLTAAVSEYDETVANCPFKQRHVPPSEMPCPKCGATSSQGCPAQTSAGYSLAQVVRAILIEGQGK